MQDIIDKIIGEDHTYETICNWTKEKDPSGVKCIHLDCWQSYGYNKRALHIRERIETLLKNLSIRRLIGDYSVSLSNTTCIFKNLHGCRIKFDPEYFCL